MIHARTKKQNGSGHVALIAVAVVALVGVLGFVGYNSWSKQQSKSNTSNTTQTTTQGPTEAQANSTEKNKATSPSASATTQTSDTTNDTSKDQSVGQDDKTANASGAYSSICGSGFNLVKSKPGNGFTLYVYRNGGTGCALTVNSTWGHRKGLATQIDYYYSDGHWYRVAKDSGNYSYYAGPLKFKWTSKISVRVWAWSGNSRNQLISVN